MRSIHMLGNDTASEWQLVDAVGGAPNRFFQLAQRIAWGITQPDLVRVDVIDTARRLVASHGSAFPAHLLDAWVWRVRDPARAELALDRARTLAAGHPLRYLLPTDQEWRAECSRQQLVEVLPDQLWRVAHQFPLAGAPFPMTTTATLVRMRSGDLALFNPVALDDGVAEQITKLGKVRWLISQGKAHGIFVEPNRLRFPGALALGTAGHLSHRPAAYLELDGILGRDALPTELELIPIEGTLLDEVLVLHRPTGTLIVQDFVTHAGTDQHTSFIGRLYGFAFGISSEVGFPSYALMTWRNLGAFRASLQILRASGFTHVLSAHGPAELDDTILPAFHATVDHTLEISGLGHKLMLARYFAAQPGFLRDSLRYMRSAKNAVGARLRMV